MAVINWPWVELSCGSTRIGLGVYQDLYDLQKHMDEMAESVSTPPRSPRSQELNFLYSPEVCQEVEVLEEEEGRKGRKRIRNPEGWTAKHVKRPGLRKNSPLVVITNDTECCKKKCLQSLGATHSMKV